MKNIPILFLVSLVWPISCDKDKRISTSFTLESIYDSIRSCPDGGGIFIIRLAEPETLEGTIQLNVESAAALNTSCTRAEVDKESPVTEIAIEPSETLPSNNYEIRIHASNSVYDTTLHLTVHIFNWSSEIGEDLLVKKEEYDTWLHTTIPGYDIDPEVNWNCAYPTYPEILIVEHITFLNDAYEYRICTHAMIPPYDWSMIRLRRRNEAEPFFAARQDSTGGIMYQIPVAEYPEMFGY